MDYFPLFWNWMMIQSDELIFFRLKPPTSNFFGWCLKNGIPKSQWMGFNTMVIHDLDDLG